MVADLGKTGSAFLFIGRPKPLSPAFQGWICKNLQSAATSADGQARPLSTICLRGCNGAGSVEPARNPPWPLQSISSVQAGAVSSATRNESESGTEKLSFSNPTGMNACSGPFCALAGFAGEPFPFTVWAPCCGGQRSLASQSSSGRRKRNQ